MKFKGGRFARHPRFRYWALKTIMRHEAKSKACWYCTSEQLDDCITVDDIKDLIDKNEHHRLAQRVSRAAADIEGTRPFWQVRSLDPIRYHLGTHKPDYFRIDNGN